MKYLLLVGLLVAVVWLVRVMFGWLVGPMARGAVIQVQALVLGSPASPRARRWSPASIAA